MQSQSVDKSILICCRVKKYYTTVTHISFLVKLISGSDGPFPGGGDEPMERQRVRFALISAFFAEIKASFIVSRFKLPPHALRFVAKAVRCFGFFCVVSSVPFIPQESPPSAPINGFYVSKVCY